jgi:hypothetical protein
MLSFCCKNVINSSFVIFLSIIGKKYNSLFTSIFISFSASSLNIRFKIELILFKSSDFKHSSKKKKKLLSFFFCKIKNSFKFKCSDFSKFRVSLFSILTSSFI